MATHSFMSQEGETFFTSIGCMDGRCQEAVAAFGREKFAASYPDTITEPGLVGLLAQKKINKHLLSSITKKIQISFEKHRSKGIVVFGHQECAGNPVDDKKHRQDVKVAATVVRQLVPYDIRIIPVFVKRENNTWIVEKL